MKRAPVVAIVCALLLHISCTTREPEPAAREDPRLPSGTTSLSGKVTDQAGSELPGVKVEVRSLEDTAFVRNTTSDSQGAFSFSDVPLGACRLTFTLPQFKTEELDVLADVARSARIEPRLQVADDAPR